MSAKRDALERVGKAIGKAVDEGGVLRRLATAAGDVVDDWGWKGGKPGEISGTEVRRLFAYERDPDRAIYYRLPIKKRADFNRQYKKQVARFVSKYPNSALSNEIKRYGDRMPVIFENVMAGLEDAGVPREWTGRTAAALKFSDIVDSEIFRNQKLREISDVMRPMTNDQRQAFLNLLPRWTGTLETAASAAKKLYKRPS